ncbi:MAG: GNAT family N-acetyltransferase [Clostridiales bacterium]|nr:GNAT family N-acetyltransferase [Clostridiales bacterium]
MEIREAIVSDVESLMDLYLNHLTKYPPKEKQNSNEWIEFIEKFIADENYNLLVAVEDGKVVSSLTIVIIRNLTHNLRPYSVMENVVTHIDYRKRGYSSKLMEHASKIARSYNCYKIMLMTGSKRESTLNFYRKNGFTIGDKTACLKRL